MKRDARNKVLLLAGATLAMTSALAFAQDAPESLLPKMFETPAPTPSPSASPTRRPAPVRPVASPRPAAQPTGAANAPRPQSTPVVQALPSGTPSQAATDDGGSAAKDGLQLKRLPTLAELAKMSPEDFEELIGRKVEFDMPPQARRSMERVGIFDETEGGLPADSLASQNGALIRTALSGNRGALVSRWGHIALRRALLSRLAPPAGMSPQDFLALRVALLLRMGEPDAARSLLQDIDIANYTPAIGEVVLKVYTGTADFTGLCPVMATQGSLRDDPEWNLARSICEAYRGNGTSALSKLDRELVRGKMPRIDVLLAQRYAAAAGKSRRAVTIEWDKVDAITPWRYGLAIGVGIEPPAALVKEGGPSYDYTTALAPMVGLARRAQAADLAGGSGVLSNAAMVDLYAQMYADPDVTGEWQDRAESLRDAYTLQGAGARVAAMCKLWTSDGEDANAYGRRVLTAAAAARIAPRAEMAETAADLVGSMLAAGFDANAARWAPVVEAGSDAWAMIVLSAPGMAQDIPGSAIDSFVDNDASEGKRRAGFLVASLAGLGRIERDAASSYSNDMGLGLGGETRWTRAIDGAAQRGDRASVVMLAGFGMQGASWQRMTPRYLFHIVSALREVGLEGEARMIAAEAVSRT